VVDSPATDHGEQLAIAQEELRVADEELRSQHELIEDLVRSRLADRAALSQLTVAVPVPLIDTDSAGGVLAANPAACGLLGVSRPTLTNRPLQTFVATPDRSRVRAALSAVNRGAGTQHVSAALIQRRSTPIHTDIAVMPVVAAPDGQVRTVPPGQPAERPVAARWVVAPHDGSGLRAGLGAVSALAELASLAVTSTELRPALSRIAELVVRALGPARAGSIAVGPPATPDPLISTDTAAQVADGAQHQARQGPSWEAYQSGTVTVTERFGADARWPWLSGSDLPAVAVALPLLDGDTVRGVMTVYGGPGLAGSECIAQALIFAGAAASVVREHRVVTELRTLEQHLRKALDSRALIGQATGILMARLGCGAEEAFAALVRESQHQNVKLRAIAAALIEESTRPLG
jgi:PAS domain S-box-containing protein